MARWGRGEQQPDGLADHLPRLWGSAALLHPLLLRLRRVATGLFTRRAEAPIVDRARPHLSQRLNIFIAIASLALYLTVDGNALD